MQIHSKITGTKGVVLVYNDALRFRDMITQEAEAVAEAIELELAPVPTAKELDILDNASGEEARWTPYGNPYQ